MDVTIGIVNWNGKGYLRPCLERVFVQDLPASELSVIVFDNNSGDDSINEILNLKTDRVKFIRSVSNIGFAAAHNRIMDQVKSEFYMPLNFDVFLEQGYISEILTLMAEDESIGMATGKLRKMVGFVPQSILDSTGIEMPYYMPRPRGEMEIDKGQYDILDCRYVFGPCGAAPIYRMEMLKDIMINREYFDEHFINYVEDVDLAWRAQLRGWKGIYVSSALAFHERGVTRKDNPSEQREYFRRGLKNRYLAMYKNITPFEIKTGFHMLLIKEFVLLFSFGANGIGPVTKLRAFISAYRLLDIFREKRYEIQKHIKVKPSEMVPFFHYSGFSFARFICYGLMKASLAILYRIFRIGILLVNSLLKPLNLKVVRQFKFTYKLEKI